MSLRDRNMTGLPGLVSASSLVAGMAGILVALHVPNAYDKTIPPLIVLGALLGLFVSDEDFVEYERFPIRREWVTIAYFAVAGASVLAYVATFQRTPMVNVLLVGLYLLSVVAVLAFESAWGKLLFPIVTAVIHRTFIYYASATQLGLDALFHNRAAAAISSTGTLSALSTSKYWYTSGYHLLTAASTSVFGVGVRDAAFISVTLVMVLVAPLAIFAILRRGWGPTVAALGAFLFLVADKAISTAVHTSPTTLGAILFVLLFLFIDPYLDTGRKRYLGALVLLLSGLALTHQLSLFVVLVALGLYAPVYTFWTSGIENIRARMFTVEAILLGIFLTQTFLTKYDGPRGESSKSFFMEVAPAIINGLLVPFRENGGRTASFPPGYAVSGADALTSIQVLGKAILFCFALVGAIYWLSRRRGQGRNTVMGLGVVVGAMSAIVFGGGLIGTNVFIPSRWFAFLITPLVILAAPGLMAITSKLTFRRRHVVTFVTVLLLVTTPYVVFMFGNATGSPDEPIFDDAPGATRISTTTTEAQMYQFVDANAGDSAVVADHLAWQVINRHYGQPSQVYRTQYGKPGPDVEGEQLIVYREYATTRHASYELVYQGELFRVYDPLPGPAQGDSVIYSSGSDRIVYRPTGVSSSR